MVKGGGSQWLAEEEWWEGDIKFFVAMGWKNRDFGNFIGENTYNFPTPICLLCEIFYQAHVGMVMDG